MKSKTDPTTHTPGPWFTLDTGLDVYSEYANTDPDYLPRRKHIAAAITTHQFDETARANARLIAAAPALLAALQGLLDAHTAVLHANLNGNTSLQLEKCTAENAARTLARAAIALATGQAS